MWVMKFCGKHWPTTYCQALHVGVLAYRLQQLQPHFYFPVFSRVKRSTFTQSYGSNVEFTTGMALFSRPSRNASSYLIVVYSTNRLTYFVLLYFILEGKKKKRGGGCRIWRAHRCDGIIRKIYLLRPLWYLKKAMTNHYPYNAWALKGWMESLATDFCLHDLGTFAESLFLTLS